jgi:CheY-like chemotaxis protein
MAEILLAEDNPADVYLIREALSQHGVNYKMRVVSDGRDLLRIITGEEPRPEIKGLELIILDLNLPRHDGIEILERLRETPDMAHIPVVVLTSSDSPRDRLLATSLGATRFLRKPSGLDQFLNLGAIFKDLLRQRGGGGNEPGTGY